jgi:hypothetical protein
MKAAVQSVDIFDCGLSAPAHPAFSKNKEKTLDIILRFRLTSALRLPEPADEKANSPFR